MSRTFPGTVPYTHPSLFAANERGGPPNISISNLVKESNKFQDAKNRHDQEMYSLEHFDTPYTSILEGVQELSPFSKAFFSSQNVSWLQSHIRHSVFKKTDSQHLISNQDETNLIIVMRSIYLQNSTNPLNPEAMRVEILRLNGLVLDEVVPDILSEIEQYSKYLRDISRNGIPLERPENTSVVGTKTYGGYSDVYGL